MLITTKWLGRGLHDPHLAQAILDPMLEWGGLLGLRYSLMLVGSLAGRASGHESPVEEAQAGNLRLFYLRGACGFCILYPPFCRPVRSKYQSLMA